MKIFKTLAVAALAAAPLLAAMPAQAAYPEQSIRWLVPYPAGGGSDFLARTIGNALGPITGQSIVIENKPGGNTSIAASETARAKPDGYTVLSADNGTLVLTRPVLEAFIRPGRRPAPSPARALSNDSGGRPELRSEQRG